VKQSRYMSTSRLTAAREFRGLTKKALAEQIGIKPMSVSGYENGDWQPAQEVLEKIADILDFPVSWFSQDDISLVDVQTPTFRAQSRMTARTRHQAARAWDFAALIAEQLSKEYSLPPVSLPDLSEETPEAAARILRDEWRLGNEPISNMVHLVESKGIKVFWTDIPSQTVDAYCHWSDDQPIIVLNSNERTGERMRFNVAHELGHLVLHREIYKETSSAVIIFDDIDETATDSETLTDAAGDADDDGYDRRYRKEIEANKFASAFLMPLTRWVQESPLQPVLEAFLNLKPIWKTSIQAMIRRSYDLKLLSEGQYERAMTRISINGWRQVEPGALQPEESLLHQKVFELMAKNNIWAEDFAQSLHIRIRDLERLMPVSARYRKKRFQQRQAQQVQQAQQKNQVLELFPGERVQQRA
jgi:Zn-dependent peptidase ImmA (M78 family)/DNA-binding XRE family transcriptional regulator